MKRFTFMMLAAFVAVLAFAQKGNLKSFEAYPFMQKHGTATPVAFQAKHAPTGLAQKAQKVRRAAKRAVAAADLVGDYQWDYYQASETSTDLESLTTTAGSSHVTIAASEETEGGLTISGMFTNALEATIESNENGDFITIEGGQLAGTSSYGDYVLYGMFYYEGDEENEAGWYYSDINGDIKEDGSIYIETWLVRVLSGGNYDGYSLTPYWVEGSTLTPAEPLTLVELPEGVEAEPYVMIYTDSNDAEATVPVNVAVDGNDVYFQGISYYLPEAWVKGTMEGNVVTFPAMQYVGEYGSYGASYTFYNGDAVFTYDAEAGTYSAEGQIFGVLADQYYDGNYFNPVLKKVIEQAAMPANPEITGLKNSSYGYYITFNVPVVDTEGNGLVPSKLSYRFYVDVEREVSSLTFTPETHTKLTEDMVEIPYGFTENYDFYDTQIYLNDLYSKDWNKIGIQSIYTGGDELNVTEIQWFDIKDYAVGDVTFNFNTMDVPVSGRNSEEGDITENKSLSAGKVTLTISPKEESNSTANRFWSTANGPQLRVYSGTLTFSVPTGYTMTKIDFSNNGKWNDGNTADSGEFEGAVWTGNAQNVIVSIAGNSQINSIVVTVEKLEIPDELVVLPEGVEAEAWSIEGTFADSYGSDNIVRPTEAAVVGNDIYVKGIPFYFEEAWMKGSIDAETGIATFPTGQFVGEDEYGKEYMVGSEDGKAICDIQFAYDAEAKTLTQMTGYIVENGNTRDEIAAYGYWYNMFIYAGEPVINDPVVVPDDLATETYLFKAMEVIEEEDEETEETKTSLVEYSYQTQVGFDGQDVYFKGLSDNTADMWLKGTLSEDGKTVTIPANQFMGTLEALWFTLDYYFTAVDAENNMVDIVLNYDAENNTFTTEQTLVLHDGKRTLGEPYQTFTNVSITKMVEFAATPANPSIEEMNLTASYPSLILNIPAEDVDGNVLLTSKLFYTVWVKKDAVEQPFEVVPGDYKKVTESMTEIPYDYDDGYDIYKGGYRFYINPSEVVTTFEKIGIQSIYYGGGECNKSEIVWEENPVYDSTATGIQAVKADDLRNAVIYNMAGQRLQTPQKGLNIINGKKVMMK